MIDETHETSSDDKVEIVESEDNVDTGSENDLASDDGVDLSAGTLEPASVGESESGGDSKGLLSRVGHGAMAGIVAASSIYDDTHLDAIQNNPLINKPTSETEIVTEAPAEVTERNNLLDQFQEQAERGESIEVSDLERLGWIKES